MFSALKSVFPDKIENYLYVCTINLKKFEAGGKTMVAVARSSFKAQNRAFSAIRQNPLWIYRIVR